MSPRVPFRGDPANLTFALFSFPLSVHAIPGRFSSDKLPDWPSEHIKDRACPCRPEFTMDSEAYPKPLLTHHPIGRA